MPVEEMELEITKGTSEYGVDMAQVSLAATALARFRGRLKRAWLGASKLLKGKSLALYFQVLQLLHIIYK